VDIEAEKSLRLYSLGYAIKADEAGQLAVLDDIRRGEIPSAIHYDFQTKFWAWGSQITENVLIH
jgi:hypothetical protein